MATFTWSNGNGGNWSSGGNWIPNGAPGIDDTALILLPGQYAIGLDVAEIGSLTLNADGVNLTPTDTLKLDGSLDVKAGTLVVSQTIQGGTLIPDGGTIFYLDGTLDGVTLSGPLDLSASNSLVQIKDGITFTGPGQGQIIDTGDKGSLYFDDHETLTNVAISLGNNTSYSYLYTDNGSNRQAGFNLTLAANSTLTTEGTAFINGTSLDNKGSITVVTGYFNDSADITNSGSIAIRDGRTGNVLTTSVNTGTVAVSGIGTVVDLFGSVDNTGTISIASGGTLIVGNSGDALGVVSFLDQAGTLSFQNNMEGSSFTAQLFQNGDAIDLPGAGYSLDHVGNTITLSYDRGIVGTLTLTGQDYSNATFTVTAGSGQTILTTDAPCFCAGTMILTDRGERAVEALEVGDLVVTRQNGVETLMPVRWLGRRRVAVAGHPDPERVDPIRIARDAIAPGMPARDLFVSPDHALHLDGMLIQARQLVNGMTLTHDTGRATVTYHHVELDRHAVLIADGMPCESYLDSGNRGQFDAAGTVVPQHRPILSDVQPRMPLVTDAARVRPIWQRLAERAQAGGHVAPVLEVETDLLPWLETADGVRLAPCGDGLRFTLPPGCTRVRLRSASDRPTALAPWSDDRRRLGVAVRGLILCQGRWRQELALDQLSEGWWPVEHAQAPAGVLAWRWTDGDGHVALPEPAEAIEITLHATMPAAARTVHHPHVRVA